VGELLLGSMRLQDRRDFVRLLFEVTRRGAEAPEF
jgi:hypothetical protein